MMLDQLEISMESLDENLNENQKNKQLMDDINELEGVKPILDRWEISSKMRIWLQEKRKDISNKVRKEFEERKARKEEHKALEEIKSKTENEIDEKSENDEEIINTTSKDSTNFDFTTEDLLKEEQQQIEILIQKVAEKAELLIKLEVPSSWDHPENSSKNLRNIDGYNEDNQESKDEDLSAKLKRIRSIQASEGTITNFENLSNKAVFNTCSSSVLACLQ